MGAMSLGMLVVSSATVAAGDLVAEYTFDTTTNNQTDDSSGKGNSARVHGAVPIRTELGNALLFDGEDDWVDCGSGESLALKKSVSVECWVCPEALPRTEVGIAGKGTESYGLTYYTDGRCWWYISSGANAVKTSLGMRFWHHVVGTYDGKASRLYVNGELRDSRPIGGPIASGGRFYVGARSAGTGLFKGAIAAVRVYNYAFPEEVIAARYDQATEEMLARVAPIEGGTMIEADGYTVRIGDHGGIQTDVGADRYHLETRLSYPDKSIGWNVLGVERPMSEPDWRPLVTRRADRTVGVRAAGACYSLDRLVRIERHRIIVTDTLTSKSVENVGILYHLELTAPTPFEHLLLAGQPQAGVCETAENPTFLVGQTHSRLGWVAEDDVLRLQLEIASTANRVRIAAGHFALTPGKQYTFQWVLYPLPANADYWTFVNRVRRDWDVNFTTQGPFDYLDVTRRMDLIRDRKRLQAYLTRKKLGVIAFTPWVDYDNYNHLTGRVTSRAELKPLLQQAMAAVKAVNPEVLCIGCIEGNLVSPPPEVQKALWESAPHRPQNQYPLADEQIAILRQYDIPWKDCLLQNRDGQCRYELYYRGSKGKRVPMIAIAVYAAPGNGQHRYWLDQARFLLEEVGLDGLYIDQFNMAFNHGQRYSYDKWDGTTVDIDLHTGRIVRHYTDAGLVGIDARRDLADYVLGKGRYMLANTFPATAGLQSVRIHRFNESEWDIDVFSWPDGEKPPLRAYPCKGHFSTPISLGVRPNRYGKKGEGNYTKIIMKGAIAYLRHGLLYYHYGTEIPGDCQGAGAYGAINHMFPITPIELHEGWIVGKERTVTCVSGTYRWLAKRKPKVLVFDMAGYPVTPHAVINVNAGRWQVELELNDWAEIAVLE